MRTAILTLCVAIGMLATAPVANAFKIKLKKDEKPPVDYTEWIGIQELPSEENGVRLFYPATDKETGDAYVAGTIKVAGIPARKLMLASLLKVVETLDRENGETLLHVDYDANCFSVLLKTTQGKNNRETTYTRTLEVTANDGSLDFKTTEIAARYREKGLIPRTLPMEALHPEGNTRHGELVMEFVSVNSAFVGVIADYAATRGDISAPHLEDVKAGKVTEGMNPDEVRIVMGAPWEERKSGDKIRWIYGNEGVVIFVDGKVSRVVMSR